jgi:hypothetical protein
MVEMKGHPSLLCTLGNHSVVEDRDGFCQMPIISLVEYYGD